MVKQNSDFNPDELIKASADHEKSLAELQKTVKILDKRVGTNAALATSFKQAFENDKKMDKVLVDLIVNLVKTNDTVKAAVNKAVENADRKWWNGAWKKSLTAIGAVILALISGLAGYFIHKS